MKYTEKQKFIKDALNENLSKTVKQLHHEFNQNINYDSIVQSDNDNAQQLVSVLEAAFIHGLKNKYFEKQKRNKELPKPQFWNLICKISHKETLTQVQKLNFIRNRIGQCRAWLRFALNDAALSSYLSSLFHTAEYKTLLERYYESHALFRDNEQCDIFLRYLHGTENLTFELGCNSSILNSWTRTPLELAGILRADPKRAMHQNGVKSVSMSPGVTYSASWSQLHSSGSSHSRQGSLTNSLQMPLSSSPAFSISSQLSDSFSSVHRFAGTEVDNLVQVPLDVGEAHVDCVDGNGSRCADPVLHSRLLARRKSNKKRKKNPIGELLSSSSRCSSMSSLSSIASSNAASGGKIEAAEQRKIRTGSVTSGDVRVPSASDRLPVTNGDSTSDALPNILNAYNYNLSSLRSGKVTKRNLDDVVTAQEQSADPDPTRIRPDPEKSKILAPFETATVDETGNDSTTPPSTLPINETLTPESSRVEEASKQNDPVEEEIVDIYALPSPSTPSADELDTIDETFTEPPCTPVSAGYGNSLLCGVGWSSEANPASGEMNQQQPITSTPVLRPPLGGRNMNLKSNGDDLLSSSSSTVYCRREGYLKKKSELLFWRVRWFVLTGEKLAYYKDKDEKTELDSFLLYDVEKIIEQDMNKNNTICIQMTNGSEHLLSADSRLLIVDWCKDIRKAVDDAKKNSSAYSLDAVENTYDVLEACDVTPSEDSQLSTLNNTSWFATMKSHMTRIANEKGLDAQNYQCADCASPIGMIYGSPRVCAFTGLYYCSQCHLNQEHIIPARAIHNWDFKKRKVAKGSKKFLLDMWKEPCIDIERVNPLAYRYIDELQKLQPLRVKLTALHPYISTCRMMPVGSFNTKLRGHFYMLEKAHLYSASDLCRAAGDGLYDVINKAVAAGVNHVLSCQLCTSKGFICEVCRKNEVIFAFQTETITQCEDCKSVYHQQCISDLSKCPKCLRRTERLKRDARAPPIDENESFT